MLFNEIYGKYYHILYHILTEAHNKPITESVIKKWIQQDGFEESELHLFKRIVDNKEKNHYPLLKKCEEGYVSLLKNKPLRFLTLLEKQWLKSMVNDKRCRLFLSTEQVEGVRKGLEGIKPLYMEWDYSYIGRANDGDPYDDSKYIEHFRKVLRGVREKISLQITFLNSRGERRIGAYAPYRIEYSMKDDKFRLNSVQVVRGKIVYYSRINIARIIDISFIEDARYPEEVEQFIHMHKVKEPVEVELKDERNGFDRCFIQLSNYERNAEFDEESGTCKIKIYYYDFEETELLITLMSYGPIIKVVGPECFKKQFIERIMKQKVLLEQ